MKMTELVKKIQVGDQVGTLSMNQPVLRFHGNPIITCHDVNKVWDSPKHQVLTVHNAGVCEYKDKVQLLFRSHLRNGISVIGRAESKNGLDNWEISPEPVMMPCTSENEFANSIHPEALIENEAGGVEDPRISKFGDTFFITYSAYHGTIPDRVRVSLATTRDFKTFIRHGPVLDSDMRNVVIFPKKLGNYYYALMRPNDHPEGAPVGGLFQEIRVATTRDLYSGNWRVMDKPAMRQSGGPSAFSHKIGPGAPPIKTKYGWLSIFHGVRSTMDGNPYVLGVAFHDTDDPLKLSVSHIPILFPSQADCRVLETDYIHVPNVVFTCGALRKDDGTIVIYYGGNDTVMNAAFSHEKILYELVRNFPQDPLSGEPKYAIS
jgi:predicted GH43/DUF377 family glycosyl hydrolase